MNYFAHGRRFLDDPVFLAGTAVPDWLSVADRKCRVRSKHALPFATDPDKRLARLARGICQHHHDDGWFHETHAFVELEMKFAVRLRGVLPPEDRFRPSFLGHILVELLLDSVLIAREPEKLDRYYEAILSIDPQWLEASVNRMAPKPTDRLAGLLKPFVRERFLADYEDDARLFMRLNHVMSRVNLPQLPTTVMPVLPELRATVTARADELLTPRKALA